jgi:hypothetical protein
MTSEEKKIFVLADDLIIANDNLNELEDLIVNLSRNKTATTYLLHAVKTEYEQVLHCLKELERYGISNTEKAMLYFYDHEKKN